MKLIAQENATWDVAVVELNGNIQTYLLSVGLSGEKTSYKKTIKVSTVDMIAKHIMSQSKSIRWVGTCGAENFVGVPPSVKVRALN